MKRFTVQKGLMLASIVVWSVLLSSIAINALWVPTFEEVGHLQRGCDRTDALWFYVECSGFMFSGVVAYFLTLPYLLWLGPTLLLFNPFVAIPLWFFLIFPGYYVWSKRHRT